MFLGTVFVSWIIRLGVVGVALGVNVEVLVNVGVFVGDPGGGVGEFVQVCVNVNVYVNVGVNVFVPGSGVFVTVNVGVAVLVDVTVKVGEQ
jgi:hypothetical protein